MNKKFLPVLILLAVFLCSCQKEASDVSVSFVELEPISLSSKTEEPPITYSYPESTIELEYTSGVGAWQTRLYFEPDGAFEGSFNDSDMGDISDGYPGGTHYCCSFKGKFDNITQINEYSYSMNLAYVENYREPGLEWIEDEIRFISTPPYGVDEGTEFILYLPNTPTEKLSEEIVSWIQPNYDLSAIDRIPFHIIYNVTTDDVFFSDVFM